MNELNMALKQALELSKGEPKAFAFYLAESVASWTAQGMIDKKTGIEATAALHKLHPNIHG